MTTKPRFVIIGDIHFTVSTLELATAALKQAIEKARELEVPLIINGDTLDTKAVMRGEVVNRLIHILENSRDIKIYINVGNHDLINEKGQDHTLNFLKPYCQVVDKVSYIAELGLYIIPYMHDKEKLRETLKSIPTANTLIIHQGVLGADLGHYIQDKTSLSPEEFAGYQVYASHYHKRQNIVTPPGTQEGGWTVWGVFNYIGNPYTLSFGEANDPEKGFVVAWHFPRADIVEKISTNLRKHVIIDTTTKELNNLSLNIKPGDLVWIKVKGPETELKKLNKRDTGLKLIGHTNFKLDLIPTDPVVQSESLDMFTDEEIFDKVIDNTPEQENVKETLKSLWRSILYENY